ncbi:hypothetical protein [Luteimonas sp. 3794]|uniref:hypothetical protein n=1 Tax=Luteimonas sp. 3794 TaxID=2817730 RepID=UPI002865A6BD|nr:hypothetical protein [Luteimonas sp. 3794]MDR6990275.1 hypothetical protein [Luteimonas sp. 3794]
MSAVCSGIRVLPLDVTAAASAAVFETAGPIDVLVNKVDIAGKTRQTARYAICRLGRYVNPSAG